MNGVFSSTPRCCCRAPCADEVMEAMLASGIGCTIFFYNPNIHSLKKCELRKNENIRYHPSARPSKDEALNR
jgi:predicted adenine nucleotide alpha hydrolase (AANH) superfamily ATPase